MRHSLAAAVAALLLASCGGSESNDADQSGALSSASGACHGLKPAHCFCTAVAGPSMSTGSPDSIIPSALVGDLFTYTIPGKCYSQQVDLIDYKLNKGCWLDCRHAFGVESPGADPEVTRLKDEASKMIRASGACGGWMSAPLEFAAGTNKYRDATAMGIGIGIGGTVVVVNGTKTCR